MFEPGNAPYLRLAGFSLMDEREFLLNFSEALIDILRAVLHSHHSALQVAMVLPDWKERYRTAVAEPLLAEEVAKKIAPLNLVVAAVREGRGGDPATFGLA